MRIHFFTAPFLFFHLIQGSRFRVQGSGLRVQGSGDSFAAFLEDGILVSQSSPLGEGL